MLRIQINGFLMIQRNLDPRNIKFKECLRGGKELLISWVSFLFIIYFLQFSGKILFIFSNSAAKYYLFSPIQGKILFIFSNSGQNIIYNYFTGKLRRLPKPILVAVEKRSYVRMPQRIIRRREPVQAGALSPPASPGHSAQPKRVLT